VTAASRKLHIVSDILERRAERTIDVDGAVLVAHQPLAFARAQTVLENRVEPVDFVAVPLYGIWELLGRLVLDAEAMSAGELKS